MDSIIQVAFGIKIDSLGDPTNPVLQHAKKFFSTNLSLGNLLTFAISFFAPSVSKWLGLRLNRVPVDYFRKLTLEILHKKRRELANQDHHVEWKASNFVELMLQAEVEQAALDGGQLKQITNDEIVAQSVLFFLVG